MDDPKNDLQKIEAKRAFIEKTASDTLSKTISTIISAGLLGLISALIALFYGLPLWLYLPVGSLVFCLTCLGLFLYGKFKDRNNPVLSPALKEGEKDIENERPLILATAEISVLKGELEKLKTDHEKRKSRLIEAKEVIREEMTAENQSLREAHEKEIKILKEDFTDNARKAKQFFDADLLQRDTLLNRISFVLEPESQQKDNISSKVNAEIIEYSDRDFEWHDTPWIMFVLRIRNYSMFDITFENSIGGVLSFRKKILMKKKSLKKSRP